MASTESTPLLSLQSHPPNLNRKPVFWILAALSFFDVLAATILWSPYAQFILLVACQRLGTGDTAPATPSMASLLWPSSHSVSHSPLPGFHLFDTSSSTVDLPDFNQCKARTDVQQLATSWGVVLGLATSIPAFFTLALVGALSDRVGRKFVMSLPLIGSLCNLVGLMIVAHYNVGIWLLVVIHIFQGLAGGRSVMSLSMWAYVTDITKPEERTSTFSKFESFFFAAFTVGPLLGGWISRSGVLTVFYVAFCIDLMVLCVVLTALPETKGVKSVPAGSEESGSSSHNGPKEKPAFTFLAAAGRLVVTTFSSLRDIFRAQTGVPGAPTTGRSLAILFICFFLIDLTRGALGSVFFNYTALRFGWDAFDSGVFTFAKGLMRVIHTSITLPFLIRRYTHAGEGATNSLVRVGRELTILKAGFAIGAMSYVGIGLAATPAAFYAVGLIDSTTVVVGPTARAILSRGTHPDFQARLFSAIEIVLQASMVISPAFFGNIYRWSVATMPNLTFFIMCGVFTIAFFVISLAKPAELVVQGPSDSGSSPASARLDDDENDNLNIDDVDDSGITGLIGPHGVVDVVVEDDHATTQRG